ncbi:MAG: hypothetical protein KUG82_06165 [Pseudomonadales bacterium]|nr:hypothetical protein [Pseudomonadales bacterium]
MKSTQPVLDRTSVVDSNFKQALTNLHFPPAKDTSTLRDIDLNQAKCLDIFDSQLVSRHLDLLARRLKETGAAFYTIGSSGHENNAVLGHVFGIEDMAFLHYRSGAFMIQRSKQLKGQPKDSNSIIKDNILSLMAAKEDPISSGRHKVFGSLALNVPPQTSTIASHLPKSVGAAYGLTKAKELGLKDKKIRNLVLCSFGDASFNHACTQTSLNSAQFIAHNHYPLPLLFICEDNGIGISVPTPSDWIQSNVQGRTGLHYIQANGLSMADTYRAAKEAEHILRDRQEPVFLHLKTVRLMGHAGSDIESVYRSQIEIEKTESDDPLIHNAKLLIDAGYATPKALAQRYDNTRRLVDSEAEKLSGKLGLQSVAEIKASILPAPNQKQQPHLPTIEARQETFGKGWSQLGKPRNLNQHINAALTDLMLQYSNAIILGEDIGAKGGVYNVTSGLQKRFGQRRVMDTILDETTILGMAIGMSAQGLLPIPEIQFLAYTHNAIDQLRGEAATLSFFSNQQFTNPMVIRIASLAYQKGFGGHFHNDNAIAFLREIPGIIIACPSNGADAAKMLKELFYQAHCNGRVCLFLEPIALYMTKDLHTEGDGLWMSPYHASKDKPSIDEPSADEQAASRIPLGTVAAFYSDDNEINSNKKIDIAIISYANGAYLSRQAQKQLQEQHGISSKLIDLRWLAPLPEAQLKEQLIGVEKTLIVDECRRTGSLSEQILSWISENCELRPRVSRLTAEDCFIPIGKSWQYLLPTKDSIVDAAIKLQSQD